MLASRKPDGTSLYYLIPADQFLFSSSENLPEEVIPLSHRNSKFRFALWLSMG